MGIDYISDKTVVMSTICCSCMNRYAYQIILVTFSFFQIFTIFLKTCNNLIQYFISYFLNTWTSTFMPYTHTFPVVALNFFSFQHCTTITVRNSIPRTSNTDANSCETVIAFFCKTSLLKRSGLITKLFQVSTSYLWWQLASHLLKFKYYPAKSK